MKNDSLGEHFSWRPIYLPVDGDAVNAARAIADMLLAVPIPTSAASSTLLFCTSTAGSPMRHSTADSALRGLLVAAFPSEDPSRWSWHSFRIGCACALLAAGASMPLIQAIARWRSSVFLSLSIQAVAYLPVEYSSRARNGDRYGKEAEMYNELGCVSLSCSVLPSCFSDRPPKIFLPRRFYPEGTSHLETIIQRNDASLPV